MKKATLELTDVQGQIILDLLNRVQLSELNDEAILQTIELRKKVSQAEYLEE